MSDKLKSEEQPTLKAAANVTKSLHRLDCIGSRRPAIPEVVRCQRALAWRVQAAERARGVLLFKKWQHITDLHSRLTRYTERANFRRLLARWLGAWRCTQHRTSRSVRISILLIRRGQRRLIGSALLCWMGLCRKRRISIVAGSRVSVKTTVARLHRAVGAWHLVSRCDYLPYILKGANICLGLDTQMKMHSSCVTVSPISDL